MKCEGAAVKGATNLSGRRRDLSILSKVQNLVDSKRLIVVAGLDVLGMEATAIKHHEPIGSHLNELE